MQATWFSRPNMASSTLWLVFPDSIIEFISFIHCWALCVGREIRRDLVLMS
jgi:hypothetical protein